MEKELGIAVFAGIGAMLAWGLADIFVKKVIEKVGDFIPLFWSQIVGLFFLLMLFFSHPSVPHFKNIDLALLLFLGGMEGLSYIPLYIGFRKGLVTLLSPIYASYPVIVAIISAAFLGEIISFERQVVFVIIFIGILLINGDPFDFWLLIRGKKTKLNIKGLPEIILAVCLNALNVIILDHLLSGTNWIPVIVIIRLLSIFSLYCYAKITNKNILFSQKDAKKLIFFIGFLDIAAVSCVAYGLSMSSYTSIVAMLSSAFSLPVIIIGYFLLREKITIIQMIGCIVTVAGIMLLSL